MVISWGELSSRNSQKSKSQEILAKNPDRRKKKSLTSLKNGCNISVNAITSALLFLYLKHFQQKQSVSALVYVQENIISNE